jgi:hypothetical protein
LPGRTWETWASDFIANVGQVDPVVVIANVGRVDPVVVINKEEKPFDSKSYPDPL